MASVGMIGGYSDAGSGYGLMGFNTSAQYLADISNKAGIGLGSHIDLGFGLRDGLSFMFGMIVGPGFEFRLTPEQAINITIGPGLVMEAGHGYDSLAFGIGIDALYTSTSAVCVTGLIAIDAGDTFTPLGQFFLGSLIQVGGLGVTAIGAGIIIEGDSITVTKRRLRSFTFDATNSPDLFPALAALAAAAHGQSTIIGTQRLLHKESDRAETIRQEYEKLGIEVDISEENVMKIRGGEIHPATVFSHNDHRIAMSLAVSALRCKGDVTIENAECVEKSYPTFFEDLESITVR